MKKISALLLFTITLSLSSFAQGHKIKFDIKNLNDSVVYLARYFGDNKYIKDTIVVDGKEKFVVEGDEELDCGIYMIVREKRNAYFEFLITGQNFTVISDTADFINKTSFKNSPDNEMLYKYFRFTGEKGKKLQDTTLTKEARVAIHKEINDYKKEFVKNNPDNPMAVAFKLQEDVDMPDSIKNLEGDAADKTKYYYYLNHYWDKTDFASPCLLRTPVFHGKLQRYFDKWVPQHFDSIPIYADMVVEKASVNDEVFKYVVNYLTFKWESGKSKRMCWDKVFYHMARTYYLAQPETKTPWVEEGQMSKIRTRVQDLHYCLCNEKAVPLQMTYNGKNYGAVGLEDTNKVRHDFYQMPAGYVVLWFWDSDCGHCKKQTPKLWDMYEEFKKEGRSVEVMAINIEQESKGYLEYIREKKYDWINVQDTAHLSKFREFYDIYSTPVAFILDKERNIIGKRIDPTAMKGFFEEVFKEEEEKKKAIKKD